MYICSRLNYARRNLEQWWIDEWIESDNDENYLHPWLDVTLKYSNDNFSCSTKETQAYAELFRSRCEGISRVDKCISKVDSLK